MIWVSALIRDSVISYCNFFLTSSPTPIIVDFAKYKESPFREKAMIIIKGIKRIRDWSFSINNFFIAGSNNQAIAEVLPATKIEKKPDKRILLRYFLE